MLLCDELMSFYARNILPFISNAAMFKTFCNNLSHIDFIYKHLFVPIIIIIRLECHYVIG